MFLLKISQLRELFVVRWTVFLLGPAGCGKTAIWRTLMRTQVCGWLRCVCVCICVCRACVVTEFASICGVHLAVSFLGPSRNLAGT